MSSASLSPDDPNYDATEDPMAPYRLSLLYEPEDPLDDSLPSSSLSPGKLGNLSLFPDFRPIQDPVAWEAAQIDYPWEQRLADRSRLVESIQALEEYMWEEGLQTIEDFDWLTPEDGLDLTAASPVLSIEVTATSENEQRFEHADATATQLTVRMEDVLAASSQHEVERPEKRQKLETQPSSTELPASPPWITSPQKAPNPDPILTTPASLEIAAPDGGEGTDTIIEPETTRSVLVVEMESEPTKTAPSIDSQDPLAPSAVHEDVGQVTDSQPWDTQLQAAVQEGSASSASEMLPAGDGAAEEVHEEKPQARPASDESAHEEFYDTLTTPSKTSDQQPQPVDEQLDACTAILTSIEIAPKSSRTPPTKSAHEQADTSDSPVLLSMAEGILKREATPVLKEQVLAEESKKSSTSKSKATSRKSLKTSSTASPATLPKRPKAAKSLKESPRERFGETSDGITQHDTDRPASVEIYFEEDTPPESSPVDARNSREDIQNDDEYNTQERLTDTSETKAYERAPRNTVSNRELAALGSTFTPGMHLGLHQGQPKRARKSNETRYSESSSDVEITSVRKKQRAAPATGKKPKKTNLEAQRTQEEIELSEEEHNDLFSAPKYVKVDANKRRTRSSPASSAHMSDVEEKPKAKRNSLLKNALTPSAPVKNKFGFSPHKTTPATKGGAKGKAKGKEANAAAEESTKTPLTRRKSQQLERESARMEKDTNIGKRLRSKDSGI